MKASSSINAPLPKGWDCEINASDTGPLGIAYKVAIDPDGCRWYWEGRERWTLEVPWFRSSRPGLEVEDLAVVSTIHGNREYPISKNGTIKIGTRRIKRGDWNH